MKLYAESHLGIYHHMDREPAYESGGAGLLSTIDDAAKFTTMLMNQGSLNGVQLLKPRTVQYMTTAVLSDGQQKGFDTWHSLQGYSYGNQMRILKDTGKAGVIGGQGEYGWDGWLGAYFTNSPQDGLTFLFMIQKKMPAHCRSLASCVILCLVRCKKPALLVQYTHRVQFLSSVKNKNWTLCYEMRKSAFSLRTLHTLHTLC